MDKCQKCLLDSKYTQATFDNGICSLCSTKRKFTPLGEDKLISILNEAKNKNAKYDVLVPLSGGKDSTYILHLAVNVYKLNVLAMTYDNGLFSQLAIDNIKSAIKKTGVDHIFCKPDIELLKKVYRNMLIQTGDICGACDIGTKANILKVAEDYKVPIILYGTSPLENDSFIPDSIQDVSRFKYVMKISKNIKKSEVNDFLIYPNLNMIRQTYYKKIGKFSKDVSPLFYIENPTDKEMGEIIKKELDWQDQDDREYSKHLDCIAEPFTNYIRHKIYGFERRKCQYSNMIRRNEITKIEAERLYKEDNINAKPSNYAEVLKHLGITEQDVEKAISYKPLHLENKTSRSDKIYTYVYKTLKPNHA